MNSKKTLKTLVISITIFFFTNTWACGNSDENCILNCANQVKKIPACIWSGLKYLVCCKKKKKDPEVEVDFEFDFNFELELGRHLKNINIGPRYIRGYILNDVRDDGNCFYYAIVDQLRLISHYMLDEMPTNFEPHVFLRRLVQGDNYRDEEWVEHEDIFTLIRQTLLVIGIIDTRHPHNGFRYYYLNQRNEIRETTNVADITSHAGIVRLAYTGDHYLSVISFPNCDEITTNELEDPFRVDLEKLSFPITLVDLS